MKQHRILVVYATRYGQTAKVAVRIGNVIRPEYTVDVKSVAELQGVFHPAQYSGVILAGSVYFGKHQRALRDFVRAHLIFLITVPTAFVSVSGAGGAQTEEARLQVKEYLERFRSDTAWNPRMTLAVAGGVPYTRYSFVTRWFMKRLARKRGRFDDTAQDYEYTDWNAVEQFALDFLAMMREGPGKA